MRKEFDDMGLSPGSECHRSESKPKGGLLRSSSSMSKRRVNGPVPLTAPDAQTPPPLITCKSLENLEAFRQHDRAKSKGIPTKTPLIMIEDVDNDAVDEGVRPKYAGWRKRHLSVKSTREKWQELKS